MQVLVVVIDDDGESRNFRLEKFGDSRNYDKFRTGDMGKPLIGKVWIVKGFKAEKKS